MAKVHKGRYTAAMDEDFVVFLIGMRFNKLWKVHRWMPVFVAMPKMLRVLQKNPDRGLLNARLAFGGRTITSVQYWRSFEHLERFARDANDPHLAPWRKFNKKVGASGDVGIYHETYKIHAGDYETVYGNMPIMGLAAAGTHLSVTEARDAARQRMTASAT
ncbi:MAG: DUF4188 domain-containing protein [Actinomycetia bacterium]|nr:DUF4188 domain-containing protein [Actinomycetes bacterium]